MPSQGRWLYRAGLPVPVRRRLVEPAELLDCEIRLQRLRDLADGDEGEAETLFREDEDEVVVGEFGEVDEEEGEGGERARAGAELGVVVRAEAKLTHGSEPEEGGAAVDLVDDGLRRVRVSHVNSPAAGTLGEGKKGEGWGAEGAKERAELTDARSRKKVSPADFRSLSTFSAPPRSLVSRTAATSPTSRNSSLPDSGLMDARTWCWPYRWTRMLGTELAPVEFGAKTTGSGGSGASAC